MVFPRVSFLTLSWTPVLEYVGSLAGGASFSVVCSKNVNSHSHGEVSSGFRQMNPHAGHSLEVLPVTSQFDFCDFSPKTGGRWLPSFLTHVRSELIQSETKQHCQNNASAIENL